MDLILCALVLFGLFGFAKPEEELVVTKYSQCPEYHNLRVTMEPKDLVYGGGKDKLFYISGTAQVNEQLHGPLSLRILVKRCTDKAKDEDEACQRFLNATTPDICPKLPEDGAWGHTFLSNVGIPPKCPLEKGRYVFEKNPVIVNEKVIKAGLTGNYWKVWFTMMNTKTQEVYACISAEGTVKVVVSKRQQEFNFKKRF